MTVESNYVIAIAAVCDWLKNLAPVFQPMKSKNKTKTNCTFCVLPFPRYLSQVGVFSLNSDWFIVLCASVVITQSFENHSMRHTFSVC